MGLSSSPVTLYDTCVYYHNNTPTLDERIIIHLPAEPEGCHLFLQYFHCPRDEGMYPIGYAFLRLWRNGRFLPDGRHRLPVLKYSKKSGKSTEASDYLAFDAKLTAELTHGCFAVSTGLVSTRLSHDEAVNELLAFHAREAAGRAAEPPRRDIFAHLRRRPLQSVARWFGAILDSVFWVLEKKTHQPLHHDAAMYLAYLCGQDHQMRQGDGELKRALGWRKSVEPDDADSALATAHNLRTHIQHHIAHLTPCNSIRAARVVLNQWRHVLSLPVAGSMPRRDPRWADVLNFVQGGELLFGAVVRLLQNCGDGGDAGPPRSPSGGASSREPPSGVIFEILQDSCGVLALVTNDTGLKGPAFRRLQLCTVRGLPAWLRATQSILSSQQIISVMKDFWVSLDCMYKRQSMGPNTSMVFLEAVTALVSVGMLQDVGFRTMCLPQLLDALAVQLRSDSMGAKLMSARLLSLVIPKLVGSESDGEECVAALEADTKNRIKVLNERKVEAAMAENYVVAQKCKSQVEALKKSLSQMRDALIKGKELRGVFVRKVLSMTLDLIRIADSLFSLDGDTSVDHNQQSRTERFSPAEARAIVGVAMCSLGVIGRVADRAAQSPLMTVLRTGDVRAAAVTRNGGPTATVEQEQRRLQVAMRVARCIVSSSCFDRLWVQLRLVELHFVVGFIGQLRLWWAERASRGVPLAFRLEFWKLVTALLQSRDVDLRGAAKDRRTYVSPHVRIMVRLVVADVQHTFARLSPADYMGMSSVVLPPVVTLARSQDATLRGLGTHLLFQLMDFSWKDSKSLRPLEHVSSDLVHHIVTVRCKPAPRTISGAVELRLEAPEIFAYEQVFTKTLRKEFEERAKGAAAPADAQFVSACQSFFDRMATLFKHLYLTESVKQSAVHEDTRVDSYLVLIHSFRRVHNMRLFEEYVHALTDQHDAFNNRLEQAHSLLLHASELGWSMQKHMPGIQLLPADNECARHHRLLKMARDVFESVHAYGKCAEVSGMLAEAYRSKLFDIPSLCEELRTQAGFYNKVLRSDAVYPRYYLVTYSNHGFDADLKGKVFVYRSSKPHRAFSDELKRLHPDAKVVNRSELPRNKVQHCVGVTTLSCSSPLALRGEVSRRDVTELDERYKRYLSNNDVTVFSFSKTYGPESSLVARLLRERKAGRDRAEHAPPRRERDAPRGAAAGGSYAPRSIYVVQNFVVVEEAMPCSKRRVPVISRQMRIVTPLQAAVITLKSKNEEISETTRQVELTASARGDIKGLVNRLSQQLNGTIDAAVNGGIKNYIKAFFDDGTYFETHPGDAQSVAAFQIQLKLQMQLLDAGLLVFGKHCGEQLRPLYSHLSLMHQKMEGEVRHALSRPVEAVGGAHIQRGDTRVLGGPRK